MTDRDSLLAAIRGDGLSPEQQRAARAEDTPRLAYADWCEENGDPWRAAFIRGDIECARIASKHADRTYPEGLPAVVDVLDGLNVQLVTLAPAQMGIGWRVRRGFVSGVSCSWSWWILYHRGLRAAYPLERVVLLSLPEMEVFEDVPNLRYRLSVWIPFRNNNGRRRRQRKRYDCTVGRQQLLVDSAVEMYLRIWRDFLTRTFDQVWPGLDIFVDEWQLRRQLDDMGRARPAPVRDMDLLAAENR